MKEEENMKQKLKYLEAVLMAMSIGLLFMPLIEISEVGISLSLIHISEPTRP